MRKSLVLLVLLFLLVGPVQVMGADYKWTLTWHPDQTLTETITTEHADLVNQAGNWQNQNHEGDNNTFTRTTAGWQAYNQLEDRLPIIAKTKNYVVIKITKIKLDSETYQAGQTFYEMSQAGPGQVTVQVPGFIMKAKPAVKSQWAQGFTATWSVLSQDQTDNYYFTMQAITLEILPSILALLIIGWGLIWFTYKKQVKRIERLIDQRYSLDNIVMVSTEEIPTLEEEEVELENREK